MFSPSVGDPCTYTGRGGTQSDRFIVKGPYTIPMYGETPVYDAATEINQDEDGNVVYVGRISGYPTADEPTPGRLAPRVVSRLPAG